MQPGLTHITTAIRLRPPLGPSDPNYDLIPARFRKSACQVENDTTLCVESSQGQKRFLFDRVFGDHEAQEDVWEYVSGGVDSFVQGYNVSLLAYGQSGAGKSYTMGTAQPGEHQIASTIGIIPRAGAALFEKLSPIAPKLANGSGIRLPTRYSMSGPPTPKEEKPWQLHATYVEVGEQFFPFLSTQY